MSHLAALVPLIALLAACSSKPSSSDIASLEVPLTGRGLREPQAGVTSLALYGDFATNPNAERFIDKMVSEHGFDRLALHNLLAQTRRLDSGIAAYGAAGAWACCASACRTERRLAALS